MNFVSLVNFNDFGEFRNLCDFGDFFDLCEFGDFGEFCYQIETKIIFPYRDRDRRRSRSRSRDRGSRRRGGSRDRERDREKEKERELEREQERKKAAEKRALEDLENLKSKYSIDQMPTSWATFKSIKLDLCHPDVTRLKKAFKDFKSEERKVMFASSEIELGMFQF